MKISEVFKNAFFYLIFICFCQSVNAGLNNFTDLIFFEEWLIERKFDLTNDEIICRASIPSHANWFGARVRLGPNNQLIKPLWISVKASQLDNSQLTKVKELLNDCRSGLILLSDDL